jgi:hypothetical protein
LCTPESHLPPPSPPQRHSLLVSLVPFGWLVLQEKIWKWKS